MGEAEFVCKMAASSISDPNTTGPASAPGCWPGKQVSQRVTVAVLELEELISLKEDQPCLELAAAKMTFMIN